MGLQAPSLPLPGGGVGWGAQAKTLWRTETAEAPSPVYAVSAYTYTRWRRVIHQLGTIEINNH